MKKNIRKELHDKTIAELRTMLTEYEKDVATIAVSQNAGKMKNVALLGKKRKDVARILTIISEKGAEKPV